VLELMAEGRSNQAIAERLVITLRAVEKHRDQHLREAPAVGDLRGSPAGPGRSHVPAFVVRVSVPEDASEPPGSADTGSDAAAMGFDTLTESFVRSGAPWTTSPRSCAVATVEDLEPSPLLPPPESRRLPRRLSPFTGVQPTPARRLLAGFRARDALRLSLSQPREGVLKAMSPLKRSNNIAARMGRWSASHWKTRLRLARVRRRRRSSSA
jgi:hypothetical protein